MQTPKLFANNFPPFHFIFNFLSDECFVLCSKSALCIKFNTSLASFFLGTSAHYRSLIHSSKTFFLAGIKCTWGSKSLCLAEITRHDWCRYSVFLKAVFEVWSKKAGEAAGWRQAAASWTFSTYTYIQYMYILMQVRLRSWMFTPDTGGDLSLADYTWRLFTKETPQWQTFSVVVALKSIAG